MKGKVVLLAFLILLGALVWANINRPYSNSNSGQNRNNLGSDGQGNSPVLVHLLQRFAS